MATRIYSDTVLSASPLRDLLATVHRTIVQHGRDYVYQERVTHRVAEPQEFLLAQVRGYQDDYVPYSRQVGGHLIVGCTCNRSVPCAHVAALWWSRLQNPDEFMRAPYEVRKQHGVLLPENAAGIFPWDLIPAEKPVWQKPWDAEHSMPEWLRLLERARDTTSWEETKLSRVLFDLHPTWTSSREWLESWSGFLVSQWSILTKPALSHWWDLILTNPRVPIAPLWPGYMPVAPDQWLLLFSLTLTNARPEVRTEALCHLIDLSSNSMLPILSDLIREVPALDAWHLVESRILDRQGLRAQAIKLLEGTSLDSALGRRILRQQLIKWLPASEGLTYQITDCLESDSWDCLETLKPSLDAPGYQSLQAAKMARLASRADVSDAEPQ